MLIPLPHSAQLFSECVTFLKLALPLQLLRSVV